MSKLHIDEFRLRIPGVSPARARTLAQNTARRVAERLTQHRRAGRLGLVDLRVSVAPGSSPDQIEAAVVESILRGLGQ